VSPDEEKKKRSRATFLEKSRQGPIRVEGKAFGERTERVQKAGGPRESRLEEGGGRD